MGMHDRLREERERMGMTQSEMGVLAGVKKLTQLKYEKGERTPSADYMAALADAGANVLYILTGDEAPKVVQAPAALTQDGKHPTHTPGRPHEVTEREAAFSDYIYVPRFDLQAAAGAGAAVHEENLTDYLAFRRDWIVRVMGLDARWLALIDVCGDSMTPTLSDGDLILLDTRKRDTFGEGIYVINLGGALLVKRLRMRLSGTVDVISDNERYGSESISGEQLSALVIVGRVVWQGRRI